MRRFLLALFLIPLAASAAYAQADYAARQRQFSLSAGVIGSAFNPGYSEADVNGDNITNWKFGPGAFVDVRFTHWVQLEAEGRWMRWNAYVGEPYQDEFQDHYLVGPRVPIKRLFHRYDTYGKVLFGAANMETDQAVGWFSSITFGGTVERRLGKRFNLRLADFEYHFDGSNNTDNSTTPPTTKHITVNPYGLSVGVSYKIF